MIKQITVFLENDKGRLAALCGILGDANISMRALTVADTMDYGVARIIADDPDAAASILTDGGYRAKLTDVFAVEVPDAPGGLAKLLRAFDDAAINVEYAYCFSVSGGNAVDILRVNDDVQAKPIIEEAGFKELSAQDVLAL
ncbi:MAG: ACT domain-containing protein [Coriobacteriales bacterium]|jgi:hypothetical protein|nr:ACT domain-containing protein [Coriobacteriales bacterium]